MTEIGIRPARPGDADQLGSLHVRTWRIAYAGLIPQLLLDTLDVPARSARWRTTLESGRSRGRTWVAVEDGTVIGFTSSGPARGDDPPAPLELWALYVDPDRHGEGIAQRLADASLGSDPAFLWVLEGNARAIRFYEKAGFALDGVRKDEPRGGVLLHELRMARG